MLKRLRKSIAISFCSILVTTFMGASPAFATHGAPIFSIPVPTANGFTVNITNYLATHTYSFRPGYAGTPTFGTPSGSIYPITVTGLTPGQSSTLTVRSSLSGNTESSVTGTGGGTITPTFSTPVATSAGFTVNVTNWNSTYTFTPATSAGSVSAGTASGSTLPLTVTSLTPGESATVTVTTSFGGFTGSATVIGTSISAALTPTFDTPVQTATGFTVNITNYDAAYTFARATTAGTVSAGTASGSILPLTVALLSPAQEATVTITVTRTGYATGSATVSGTSLSAALTPTFDTPVQTVDGFTVNVTNYNASYTFTPSTTEGIVAAGTPAGSTLPLTVTGLTPAQSATVTMTVTRTGYVTGSATRTAAALSAALTPTFDTPVRTATGFTVNVTNYDAAYTFTPTSSPGTVTKGTASGATLPLTVTGLSPAQSATVTMTVTRTSYVTGSATVSDTSLSAALTPTFDTPVQTATGFTVNITNYDDAYTFTRTMSAGTVTAGTADGATLPLTVTGLTPGQSAIITVATIRTGYVSGSATVTGVAQTGAALTPIFDTPVQTTTGFTVNITNYDAAYTFTRTMSAGTVSAGTASGEILPLTVTGLAGEQSATLTVTTTRTGYFTGSANVSAAALTGAALTPTFSTPVQTTTGFTVNITNYDASFTFTSATTEGTVTPGTPTGATLPLTVTGLTPGQAATITVTTTRTGYFTGSETVNSSALIAALTPTFSTPVQTATGFTVNVTNYDAAYAFTSTTTAPGTVSAGTPIDATTLPLTVTGLTSGQSATITVATTRTGYNNGSATVGGSALIAALTPTFGTAVATANGFTLQITNYNSAFSWSGESSASGASVAINSTGLITVSDVTLGTPSTVTVSTTRAGYVTGSATSSAFTLYAENAPTPTFGTATPTANGFTLEITNFDAAFTWSGESSASGALVGINSTGLVTVTGVNPGTASTVTITTSGEGYNPAFATSSPVTSLTGPALTPTFDTPVSTATGFTVNVINYDAAYTFTPATTPGTVTPGTPTGTTLPLTVTGLSAAQSATVTVSTTRSGYDNGSGTVTGSSLEAALTPTFSTPVQTTTGFTVNVTNYDANFTFSYLTSAGVLTPGAASGTILPLTITGLTAAQSATITVTTTRTGYVSGSGTVTGTSLEAALTPTFSTPVQTVDGFTVNVTNYSASYTFTSSTSPGTVTPGTPSGSILPLTVTALDPAQPATVTVSTTRSGYVSGIATVTGSALSAALTPTFDTPVSTATGFTVNVTNYDAAYIFTPATTPGTVTPGTASGTTLPLTVTGLSAAQSATVTVSTTRSGYVSGSATVTSAALLAALVPTFDTPVQTVDGYTVNVTNYDANFTFTPSTSAGVLTPGAASGTTLPLTITGLTTAQAATITVATTRTGYANGSATVTSTALLAALTPTFSTPVPTATGFTVNVTNYNAAYTFTPSTSPGTVTPGTPSGSILPLTVTALDPAQSATVTVATARTGYNNGSATVTSAALLAAL
ncbi:MAG: hypothetical protein RI895_700, partial [Actinomycetota bacterium]